MSFLPYSSKEKEAQILSTLIKRISAIAIALTAFFALAACSDDGIVEDTISEESSGAAFSAVKKPSVPKAPSDLGIDASHVSDGYVFASAENASRLKFQVTCGDMTYNYDLPNNGKATSYPVNMGDGEYSFRIMQNTEGNNYVELEREEASVSLSSEQAPFLVPNMFCSYTGKSKCVSKARELVADSGDEGQALSTICSYVIDNIDYDTAKAVELSTTTGYVPNPDSTLADGSGICFDYSSLAAAMLRSQGIPTQIVTGYVEPGNVYHAWTMVYINGTWKTVQFDVKSKTWSRVDTTFASTGGSSFVGDGTSYADRYIY